jgi:DNA-binding NarL/FixJ family response regulator
MIIVVEEQPAVLWAVTELLSREPRFEVLACVADGRLTAEAVERHRPDIVVLDVSLTGADPMDLTRSIKANTPGIRVLLFCDQVDDGKITEWMEAGVDAYCQKSHLKNLPYAVKAVMDGIVCNPLTSTEAQVMSLMREGASNSEIADELGMDKRTVRVHVRRLLEKAMCDRYSETFGVFYSPN